MSPSKPKNVAIIGAGLSGLSLALALDAQSIRCSVYERHSRSFVEGGDRHGGDGIMLSPNSLRIFHDLGLYESLFAQGYSFERLIFKNGAGETTGHFSVGNTKLYGYGSLRIRRQLVIKELLARLRKRGVSIQFDRDFSKVLQESEDGVLFEFGDRAIEKADLLFGADGVHSSLRHYVCPSSPPKYSGCLALTSHVPASKLRFPCANYPLPISITARPGLFLICPQTNNGDEVLVGTQYDYPEQSVADWETLLADKTRLLQMIRRDYREWPDVVRSALEALSPADMSIWPYYITPRLERWFSTRKKIILVGDSARVTPPGAIEGVNQAFEDAYTLSILLGNISANLDMDEALLFWQEMRQDRVDRLNELMQMMKSQRSFADQLGRQDGPFSLMKGVNGIGKEIGWLYEPDLKKEVLTWIERRHDI